MEIYVKDIMQLLEDWAPSSLAESWDHPGLQVGNPNQSVHKILVALDMTELNISYAIDHGVDMVISHHPFLFKPIHDIDLSKIDNPAPSRTLIFVERPSLFICSRARCAGPACISPAIAYLILPS